MHGGIYEKKNVGALKPNDHGRQTQTAESNLGLTGQRSELIGIPTLNVDTGWGWGGSSQNVVDAKNFARLNFSDGKQFQREHISVVATDQKKNRSWPITSTMIDHDCSWP